jgi:hypothetical protein
LQTGAIRDRKCSCSARRSFDENRSAGSLDTLAYVCLPEPSASPRFAAAETPPTVEGSPARLPPYAAALSRRRPASGYAAHARAGAGRLRSVPPRRTTAARRRAPHRVAARACARAPGAVSGRHEVRARASCPVRPPKTSKPLRPDAPSDRLMTVPEAVPLQASAVPPNTRDARGRSTDEAAAFAEVRSSHFSPLSIERGSVKRIRGGKLLPPRIADESYFTTNVVLTVPVLPAMSRALTVIV